MEKAGKGFPRKENWKRHLRNRHGVLEQEIREIGCALDG